MMKYRPDIDGLRAVAVLPVVLYHAGLSGISGGFLGVDVFFVISGFLITSIVATELSENRFSLWSFYERRARRILPALTVVVLSTFVFGWFFLLPGEYLTLGQSALGAALFLSNVYFTLTLDYFGPAAEYAPLLHTWSLAVEEQFYLFFPPLLALLFARWNKRVAFWAVAVLSVLSLAAAAVMLPIKPDWVFYLIFFRAWEMGIGALLALGKFPAPRNRLAREFIGVAGLLAIVIPYGLYDSSTPFPGLAAIPPVVGAMAIIYVGANGLASTVSSFLANRVFVWVGLISYSLYLWHWPILSFLRIGRAEVSLPLSLSVIAVVASVVVAWASYRFVEHPFRARPPKGFGQSTVFALSGVMLLAMISVGGLLHLSNGMPSRINDQVFEIAKVADDRNPDRASCIRRMPEDGLCLLGTPAADDEALDFLLWGDSHAEAMRFGLDRAAQTAGKNGVFAGTSACVPTQYIQRPTGRRSCNDINQATWAMLQDRSDMAVVVLAARWSLSVEGTRYRRETGDSIELQWLGDPDQAPTEQTNATVLEAGLEATVADILSTGRDVVILGPVPEVGWNVPNVLARQEMLPWLADPPAVSQADHQARAGRAETLLRRVADQHDRVRYIPLSDLFCDGDTCAITDASGIPLYLDDDHITRETAGNVLPERLSQIWTQPAQ